ncbi:unnamed protein product [Urochloa humidicola]
MGSVFAVCPSQQRQIKGAPDDWLDLKLQLAVRTRLLGTLMASCLRLSRFDSTVASASTSMKGQLMLKLQLFSLCGRLLQFLETTYCTPPNTLKECCLPSIEKMVIC